MANPLICVFNPVTSFIDEVQSISQAQNPPVIGAPIVTNINGLIDASLVGAGVPNITAGESVSGGNLVSLYSVGGVLKMQLAWAGTGGSGPSGQSYPISANGFVTAGTTINGFGVVLFGGIFTYIDSNTEFGPGDVGSEVYLDIRPGNKGGITKLRPSGIGQLQQTVGQVVNFTSPNVVQVSFVSIPNPPLLNFSNISTGTNTAATMTVGAGATLTQTGGGIINANQLTSDPVNTSGRTTGQALVFNGTTWVPSSAPATTFSAITSGTNTTATMTVGGGASLTFSGGTINANQLVGVTISGVAPTVGQVLTATSPTAAHWASSGSGSPGGANTDVQYNNSGAFGGDAGFTWDTTTGSLSAGKSGIGGSGAFTILFDTDTTSGKTNQVALGDGFVNVGANIPGSVLTLIADQNILLEPLNGVVQVGGSVEFGFSTPGVGFFGTPPQPQATITGSRFGNTALASLLTALAGDGLIVNSTTAGTAAVPGGSPTNIQYNLAGAFAGIAGSAVTVTGGVTLAPTGVVIGLTVVGETTGADDIANFNASVAGGSGVTRINQAGGVTITVDPANFPALAANGQNFLSASAYPNTTPLLITGDSNGVAPILQIFEQFPVNQEVVRINQRGHLTVQPSGLVGTQTAATITAVGDSNANNIQELWAYNGGTITLTDFTDQYGNVKITPFDTGAIACLTVFGTNAGTNNIAEFGTTGSYITLIIAPPNNAGSEPAMLLTGDGTFNTLTVDDNVLGGNPILAIYPSNGMTYAPVIVGQGSVPGFGIGNDDQFVVTTTQTVDTPSTVWYNIDNITDVNVAASPSNTDWGSQRNIIQVSGTADYNQGITGFFGFVSAGTTGAVSALIGAEYTAVQAGFSPSVATLVVGVKTAAQVSSGSHNSVVTNLHGLESSYSIGVTDQVTAKTVGMFVADATSVLGTAAHNYGLYIADQTTAGLGGVLSDPWAIFVAGGVSGFTGIATGIVTKTTTYTAHQNDHTINCNGTFTLTLDAAGQGYKTGQEFYIKNIGTGVITVSSSVNIDGALTVLLNTQYQSITIQWDGTQYWIY